MSIIKWKDLNEMMSIKDEVDHLFDTLFNKTSFHSWEEKFQLMSSGMPSPEFSIYQKGEDTVIQVALPDFQKGDIKVSVSGNLLAIGSEINREREVRGDNAYRYQRSHGSFCKVMELPAGVDAGNIRSSFTNGVLEVVLPRTGSGTKKETKIPIDTTPAPYQNALPDTTDTDEE